MGSLSTKTIKDSANNDVTMRVWDESGSGAGPFSFITVPHIGNNSPDTGVGTGGSATQRVALDSAQVGALGQQNVASATTVIQPADQNFTVRIDPTQVGSTGPQTSANSTSVTPANTSDATFTRIHSSASNNATNIKAAAGVMRSLELFNSAASTVYFKLYNKASTPALASDTPVWTIPLTANTRFSVQYFVGMPFANGISYAIVTGIADSNTTAVAAADVTGQIGWV